ncbi:T9SS type A sorting domain-containing protein [Flavobacterium sp. GT2N3]|uniref:T9SS type A sorting domain-containing protein n=1 Tax=unclassified Flavobacterium TaxID=196869 RepID=UPI003AAAA463
MKSNFTLFLLAFLIFVGNVNSYSNGVKIDPPKVSILSNGIVQVCPTLAVTATVGTAISCTGGTTTLTVSATGGASPYTFSINGGAFQSSNIFTNVTAGAYVIIAKDANGCLGSTATIAVILSVPAAPVAAMVTLTQPTCSLPTGTITVSAPIGTGLTYSINGINYQSTLVFANLAVGSYNVTVKNSAGCISTATVAVILSVPAAPIAATVTLTQPTCLLATGTITVTAPTGTGLTFSINGSTYQSSNIFTGLAVGSYSVTVNSGGCISTATVAVLLSAPAPRAAIVYAGASLCTTETMAAVTLTGTGGGTFTSSPAGLTINSATGLITPSASVVGTYLVTYTIAASRGCPAAVATTSVSIESCNVAEGCTLGYWKNHTNRWCSTYTPSMLFGSVFVNAPSSLANLTLLQALNSHGGGIYNLARQGVAALLNACSEEVDYPAPYSSNPQLVVNAVNVAFVTGNKAPGTLATQLDILNNSGCPLGGTSATTKSPDMKVTVAPNPSSTDFGLFITPLSDEPITIRIVDIHGRIIRQFNSEPKENIRFGNELSDGMYFIEVIQGAKRKIVKAQKL